MLLPFSQAILSRLVIFLTQLTIRQGKFSYPYRQRPAKTKRKRKGFSFPEAKIGDWEILAGEARKTAERP